MRPAVNFGRMEGGEMPNDEERLRVAPCEAHGMRVRALCLRTWVRLVDK